MKKGIHPENYRTVVFKDMSNDYAFLSRSTAKTKETIKWEDGNEYPLIKIEVSSKSHPFYTGKAQFVDTAGRIDKFRQKYGKFNKGNASQAPDANVTPDEPTLAVEENTDNTPD
ncbi:MAG: 50S ribosomal protein L31 [Crocinitomicaceae bacterium]|nr:50S ribosomal protein L31 [Crocinitomicaceae bacterium]|tara:strand:- start:670 stop:1011 length:342 start_codon:yes stop_codon:yes gene_type:complete